MRYADRILLMVLLWAKLLPSHAAENIQIRKWNDNMGTYVYVGTAKAQAKNVTQGSLIKFAKSNWGVVIPQNARGVSVARVDCIFWNPEGHGLADGCSGWVWTRGELRIRATVRYGWFDDFKVDGEKSPLLEIFIHRDSKKMLPYITGWTPGHVSEFTIKNQKYLVTQLFNAKQLSQVHRKEKLFVELDSDLILNDINFGSECGIRYSAKVVSAKPWVDSQVVARSRGWEAHC